MKIAVVVERFDGRGGCERSTAQIVHELVGRGHRVVVMTGQGATDGHAPGVEVRQLNDPLLLKPLHWLRFIRWAKRQLRAESFDVSLSMTTTVPADVIQPRGGAIRETLARNIQLRTGRWSRWSKQALVATSFKHQTCLALERRSAADPSVKKVVAVSGYVADQWKRHYGLDDARVEVIPNAAQMPEVDASTRQKWRSMIREGFNIPRDAVVYLFSAFNPRLKGIGPLTDATQRLVQAGLKPVVMISGPIGYGYQRRVAELGIRDHFRLIGITDQVAPLYVAADVTVLPTFYDPSSKVVIESLMMGTPAISTSYNGASEFILNAEGSGVRGRVIEDPADVDALASAMTQLADEDARRACVAAMDGLSETLSMRRHVDHLEAVLEQAAQPRRG